MSADTRVLNFDHTSLPPAPAGPLFPVHPMFEHDGTPSQFRNTPQVQPRVISQHGAPFRPAEAISRRTVDLDTLQYQLDNGLLDSIEGIKLGPGVKLRVKVGYQSSPTILTYAMLDAITLREPVEVDMSVEGISGKKRHKRIIGFSISSSEYRRAQVWSSLEEALRIRADISGNFMHDKMDLLKKKGASVDSHLIRDVQFFPTE